MESTVLNCILQRPWRKANYRTLLLFRARTTAPVTMPPTKASRSILVFMFSVLLLFAVTVFFEEAGERIADRERNDDKSHLLGELTPALIRWGEKDLVQT